ncbi:flagellar FlbD family protein [Gracilibacillus sp. YIM 98692]|uniref:flagellar FlbD family protein n=1 Tax=Gracilibacillus sp. YIM 98692 TaxID=2663532 RepID=UPI0013D00FA7|nr:flagellar FlbD family protein [Gracilibacillus sp. YIM 98692]
MIELTRLNHKSFVLNALLIEQVETFSETTITLANQKKVTVKESKEEVMQLVTDYYKKIGLYQLHREIGDQIHES